MKKLTQSLALLAGLALFGASGATAKAADIGVSINLGSAGSRRVVRTYQHVIVPSRPRRYRPVYPYPTPAYRGIGLWQDGVYLRVAPGFYPTYPPRYRFYY